MTAYELTYIIRPDVPTAHVDSVLGKITDVIKKPSLSTTTMAP